MSLTIFSVLPSATKNESTTQKTRFSGAFRLNQIEPYIAKSQIINRTIIETVGYTFWAVLFARNNFERGERILDWMMWMGVGALLLPFTGRWMNKRGLQAIQKLGVTNLKALETPFEKLEHFAFKDPAKKLALAAELGLKDHTQVDKVAKAILKNKLLIIGMNLLLLAGKGQAFYWGKNFITEHLSGRKGFVGEFNIADKAYTKKKSDEAEKTKRFRQIISITAGLAAVIGAPLWIYTLVKNPFQRGPLSFFKKLLPYYNYADGIHLGKAVLIFHNIFNWFLPSVLSARDNHERREVFFKNVVFDVLYFFGDMMIASGVASWLQSKTSYAKQLGNYCLTNEGKGIFGIKMVKDYSKVFTDVENKLAPPIALKLARINFWSGILGTALCLGIATTLLNNWYTKRKVTEEQKTIALNKPELQPSKTKTTIPPQPTMLFPQQIPSFITSRPLMPYRNYAPVYNSTFTRPYNVINYPWPYSLPSSLPNQWVIQPLQSYQRTTSSH